MSARQPRWRRRDEGTKMTDRSTRADVDIGGDTFVAASVHANASDHRAEFQTAQPFKHTVIEPFFTDRMAIQLLADFPRFDPEKARNEFGRVGRKAVNERLATISPAYAELAAYLQSDPFLQLMSLLTGIADFIP